MSKVRVIPTLLTDGVTVVKGESFESWRSVGSPQASARLFSLRNVDELMLLDVLATSQGRTISIEIIEEFADILSVPFSVGGGISNLESARSILRSGAEKIVVGTAAYLDPNLIYSLANEFGSQAIIVSIDVLQNEPFHVGIKSGSEFIEIDPERLVNNFEKIGVGEILLQSIQHDGKMKGMNFSAITNISNLTQLPVIASSGAGSVKDFAMAIECGASAVAAGALFQFTETTPKLIRDYLKQQKFQVRNA